MHIHGPKLASLTLGAAVVLAVLTSRAYADNNKNDDIDVSVAQQGFDASPIPPEELNLKGRNPYLVGLGSYLTFAGDCVGCHSFPRFLRPGGTPTNISGQGSAPSTVIRRSAAAGWLRYAADRRRTAGRELH